MSRMFFAAVASGLVLALSTPAMAQGDAAMAVAAQKEAMRPLAILDGAWRGSAWTVDPAGRRFDLTQTERVGSFLDGSVKVVEGRGYMADGSVGFNAFAIISYDPQKKSYSMKSYAQGRAGEFPLQVRADGFDWQIPAGPQAIIRYSAVIRDGVWLETGEYVAEGRVPRRFFEMSLRRISDTDWPAGDAVPMR